MNKLYIDQIVRYMNSARLEFQNYYDDVAMATGAMKWFIEAFRKTARKLPRRRKWNLLLLLEA